MFGMESLLSGRIMLLFIDFPGRKGERSRASDGNERQEGTEQAEQQERRLCLRRQHIRSPNSLISPSKIVPSFNCIDPRFDGDHTTCHRHNNRSDRPSAANAWLPVMEWMQVVR